MIKVISDIGYNREKDCTDVRTRVFIGYDKDICDDCKNIILKAELKALISSVIGTRPDLLYDALEEVTQEVLGND